MNETTAGDTVRLFHAGSMVGNLVDLLFHPSSADDKELADTLAKVKGRLQ